MANMKASGNRRQEEAPVELQLDEGGVRNGKATDMTIVEPTPTVPQDDAEALRAERERKARRKRKARAAEAKRGTIAADHHIRIEPKPTPRKSCTISGDDNTSNGRAMLTPSDIFSADELSTMPVRIANTKVGSRTRVWRTYDGRWFREGVRLRIVKRKNGDGYSFSIVIAKGANQDDLEVALREVERVKAGKASKKSWAALQADWADERTIELIFDARPYGDPYTHSDNSPPVTACDEELCVEQWHEHAGGEGHSLDKVTKDLRNGDVRYEIDVRKDILDTDERGWFVTVYAHDFYGTPDDVASFVSDLQWMEQEARRANAKTAVKA